MKTEIIAYDEIELASRFIREGQLVVFPTETVYGVGVNDYNNNAIRMLYAVKKSLTAHPFIVHVASIEQIKELVEYIPRSANAY